MEVTSPAGEQTLDIYPLSKGKRILLFLADYFLYFIFSIFLFTVAAFPISSSVVNSNALESETNANTASEITLLYQNDLLFSENQSPTNFTADITFTQKKFVRACLNDPSNDNPFYTFYCGTLGQNVGELNTLYQSHDKKPFFSANVDAKGFLLFLPVYQDEFSPLLDEKNTLTSTAQTDYDTFSTSFFLPFYHAMISEIESGSALPSSSPLYAYRRYSASNIAIQNKLDFTLIVTTYSTYLLTGAILFLLVPLINSKGQTLGMMLLHEVRLGDDNLALLSRGERSFLAVYQFVFDLSFVPFLPLAYVSKITNLFNLPALDLVAVISLLFALGSLVVLLINHFNKDLADVASRSVVVDEVSYLEIEKVRNHG